MLEHTQEDINAYLQRTPEGMGLAARAEKRRMTDAYVKASGLEREDIEDRMAVAKVLGMPTSMLINDNELYQKLKPQYKLREGLLESGVNGFFESEMASRKARIGRDLMYGLTAYTPELQKEVA